MRKDKVYIAGPYAGGDQLGNTVKAIDAWHRLADLGCVPFCPHLSYILDELHPRPRAEWLAHDLEWLAVCDAVLRLPGESPGADAETAEAGRLGIPVFETMDGVSEWLAEIQTDGLVSTE